MIYVFTHKITSRVRFAFNLIFRDLMQAEFEIITKRQEFDQKKGVKISYTLNPIGDSFFIRSKPLLFEQGINDQDINIIPFHRTKAFFGAGGNSMFPFDIFAASFYLAARYEEYLPHKKDHFNRFDAEQSLAFKEDFLHQPVINICVNKLVEGLQEVYSEFKIPERSYKFITLSLIHI